jgi:hypothetical protein
VGVARGVQLGPWAAGFGGRWPRPAPELAHLPSSPPPYRRRAAGAEAARVLHRPVKASFTAHFYNLARS